MTYKEKKIPLEKLSEIEHELKRKGIPYMSTNSSEHIKYFIQSESNYPIYILNESDGFAVNLKKRMEIFYQKENIALINRVYVPPEDKSKARKVINFLI